MGEGSDHLQLIKFWPSCGQGKGFVAGRNFLAPPYYTQRAQCLRLSEPFFSYSSLFTIIGSTEQQKVEERKGLPNVAQAALTPITQCNIVSAML